MNIETTSDETGALRIQIPGPPHRYHLRIQIEWDDALPKKDHWPEGWIESTAGSITDPTFVRHPQGDFDQREDLK